MCRPEIAQLIFKTWPIIVQPGIIIAFSVCVLLTVLIKLQDLSEIFAEYSVNFLDHSVTFPSEKQKQNSLLLLDACILLETL